MKDKWKKPYKARRRRNAKKGTTQVVTVSQVNTIVDKKINKVIETKHLDNFSESNFLYHNVPVSIETDTFFCAQGTADSPAGGNTPNRIGDSVYGKKVWLKLFFDQFQDRPNLTYRITCVRIKSGAAPISPSTLLGHPQSNNFILNPVNTELSALHTENPIVYDKRFVVNNGAMVGNIGLKDCHFWKELNFTVNRKLKYLDGGLTVTGPYTLQIVLTVYDSYGSLTTDALCRLMFMRRSYIQDA